jgi:hypothetical protein
MTVIQCALKGITKAPICIETEAKTIITSGCTAAMHAATLAHTAVGWCPGGADCSDQRFTCIRTPAHPS